LRFSSWEVLNQIVDVSIIIGDWIKENAKCPPPNLKNFDNATMSPPTNPLQRGTSDQHLYYKK